MVRATLLAEVGVGLLAYAVLAAAGALVFSPGAIARVSTLLALAVVGAVLLDQGREARARWLGWFLLALASAYVVRPLVELGQAAPGTRGLTAVFLLLRLESFAPFALWRFAEEFPRRLTFGRLAVSLRAGAMVALAVGWALFLAAFAAGLGILPTTLSPGSPAGESWWFYGSLAFLGLWALGLLALRAATAAGEDGIRGRVFLAALVVALGPVTLDLVLQASVPGFRALWAGTSWIEGKRAAIFASLLALPLGTAYAAGAHRVVSVRLLSRRGVQYLLARGLLLAACVIPALLGLAYVAAHRDQTLRELYHAGAVRVLGGCAIAAWLLLGSRARVLTWLDRRYFRDRVDARVVLELVASQIREARDLTGLAALVGRGIERALHVEPAGLLIRGSRGSFVEPQGRIPTLAGSSQLVVLASRELAPLDLGVQDLQALPEVDRYWLVEAKVEVLLPVVSAAGEVTALLALGAKRSELAFLGEDLELVGAVGHAAGLAMELLELRQRPLAVADDEHPASECFACGHLQAPGIGLCEACGGPRLIDAAVPLVLAGRYRFLERLGSGGSGVVYRGQDRWLEREVAAKTLSRTSPQRSLELRREARMLAGLSHPNLAAVYGLEVWRGTPLVLLELLAGGTLADRARHGPQPAEDVVAWGASLAGALDYLHRRGLLHRDVKPGNVGFAGEGVPKLLDFGLARWEDGRGPASSEPGTAAVEPSFGVVGTIAYLSPETVRGEAPAPAVDLWGLAVVLWEAAAGRRAFEGRTVEDVVARIETGRPAEPPSSVPAELAALLSRALSPDRARRPQSARELQRELERLRPG